MSSSEILDEDLILHQTQEEETMENMDDEGLEKEDECEEEDEEEEEEDEENEDEDTDVDIFENLESLEHSDEEIIEPEGLVENLSFEVETEIEPCCRFLLKDQNDNFEITPSLILGITEINPSLNLECIINELRNLASVLELKSDDFDDNLKTNILDSFIRNRHEVLSFRAMDCISVEVGNTDQPFNEVFPIVSRRTPDFIFKLNPENDLEYLIVEVTAVSDVERAAIRKGDESRGYISKYRKEIDQLVALGFIIDYKVVMFDVFDPSNYEHELVIGEVSKIMNKEVDKVKLRTLDFLRKEYCNITRRINKIVGSYYNILFGKPYNLKSPSNFGELSFFGLPENKFTGIYNYVGVNSSIYDKLVSSWPRFFGLLERFIRFNDEGEKVIFCYDISKGRFEFRKDKKSYVTAGEWYEPLEKNWYTWAVSNMICVSSNVIINELKHDFEFSNYEKSRKTKTEVILRENDFFFVAHPGSSRIIEGKALKDFSFIIKSRDFATLTSKFEDENYESTLIKMFTDFDKENPNLSELQSKISKFNPKPLAGYVVSNDSFIKSVESFNLSMSDVNSSQDKIIVNWVKQPFIYPMYKPTPSCFVSYKTRPDVIDHLLKVDLGGYTNYILNIAASPDFRWGTQEAEQDKYLEGLRTNLAKEQRQVTSRLKELHREQMECGNSKAFPKMEKLPDYKELKSKFSALNKEINDYVKKRNLDTKKIGVIKVTTNNKTTTGSMFKKEMSHFKGKDDISNYKGVGNEHDFKMYDQMFKNLMRSLIMPSLDKPGEQIYDDYIADDVSLLKELKNCYIDEFSEIKKQITGSNIYATCCFISRMCHSLLYLSQTSLNSDYVCIDNLGTNNSILLVKGGKKIFPTKRTKLFRIIYPTYRTVADLHFHPGMGSSFKHFEFEGNSYLATPWMNLHETVVTDGLTLHNRLLGFSLLISDPNLDLEENMMNVMFNLLLALHNRRQTEVMLHNLRYIFMNCMSEISAIEEMLPEFAGFNYDFFQFWVRGCLKENFLGFATSLKKVHDDYGSRNIKTGLKELKMKHPFTGVTIKTVNNLAVGVYSTYLMSKAPTTQSLEQVSNMKSILETHDEYVKTKLDNYENCFVTADNKSLENYHNKLFESDFNFDPKLCVLVGKYFGDYLKSIAPLNNLQQKWDRTLDECWDSMANTKGLRSQNDSDFFGSKGYYVVYKDYLQNNSGQMEKIKDLIFSEESEEFKRSELDKLNQTYRDIYSEKEFEKVIFHVVDKKQRGGKREIYVMDMDTKIHQQTIEKFSSIICKMLPNEMISVPSNKRLSHVHSRVFENLRETGEKYYWVLDCRKWAPKSMIEKFMLFLTGARESLPSSFIYHCYNFFNLLRGKRVYTRKYIFDIIDKNKKISQGYKEYFYNDENKKGSYLKMKYSWVMGIFNYFSSMMHVATQMYSSHLIRVTSLKSFESTTMLHMIAHSDDSAGKLLTDDKIHLYRSSLFYEILMHGTNHLLSKKKSNKGKVYYEFLSILYIGGELLSLLAKFIGAFNFHPSDKGYVFDMNEAYSKCIELLLNGATLSQSYIAMKIQVELIHRFYFNSKPKIENYNLPVSLMGVPDSHPLMVLIMGSDSDTFRLMMRSTEEHLSKIVMISEFLVPKESVEGSFFNSFKVINQVRKEKKLKFLEDEFELPDRLVENWTINNVPFNNTALNCVQFLNKLKDNNFISSLQDETVVRRISRAFYHRSHNTTKTTIGNLSPKKIQEAIIILLLGDRENLKLINDPYREILEHILDEYDVQSKLKLETYRSLFNFLYTENIMLYKYFDLIKFRKDSIVDFKKTCKPIYMRMQKTVEECPIDFNPSILVSWIKDVKMRWSLPNYKGLRVAEDFIKRSLSDSGLDIDDLDERHLFKICEKIRKKSVSEYYCYSNMPATIREITTYQDFLAFLSHNSFSNKNITGLNIQFGKTLTLPLEAFNKDFGLPDVRWTNSFLLLFNAILRSEQLEEDIMDLSVLSPDFLYSKDRNLLELYNEIQEFWIKRPEFFKYFKPMFHICDSLLNKSNILNTDILKDTDYHSFIKRQFLVDNVWLGTGKLLISTGSIKILIVIKNVKLDHILVNVENYTLKTEEVNYINLCLRQSNLPTLNQAMETVTVDIRNNLCLGIDRNGYYRIGKADDLIGYIETKLDINLGTVLTKPELGLCEIIKRGKILWCYSSEGKRYNYVINFYPSEPTESTNLLKSLVLDNKKNNSILMGKITDASNILLELCYKELELELNLPFESILTAPTNTKIYKILKTCDNLQLCNVKLPDLNFNNVPAQNGGLLLALINYSKHDKNFDFRWQHITTPEYLSIKASQPDSFVTELVDNIRQKYYNWYDSEDREAICKSLLNIQKNMSESEDDHEFMKIACNWGFVGVSGALDELEEKSKIDNFKSIRLFTKENPFSKHFSNIFLKLIKVIFETYRESFAKDSPVFKTLDLNWYRIDSKNLNTHVMSAIYQVVLRAYTPNNPRLNLFSSGDFVLKQMLINIMRDQELISIFKKQIKVDYFLNRLPAETGLENEWLNAYNTLYRTYLDYNQNEIELDFSKLIQRDDSLELPFNKAKPLLDDYNMKLSAAKVYHQGVLSRQIISYFKTARKLTYQSQAVYLKPKIESILASTPVLYNKKYFPKHPFNPELLETEQYEDLSIELESADPDLDEIENVLSESEVKVYDYEGLKRVKIVDRGKLIDCVRINLKVALMFGGNNYDDGLNLIRQIGDNILIITDCLNLNLLESDSGFFYFFRSINNDWIEHSIIQPRYIFYIIISRRFNDIRFWESYLHATAIKQEELDYMIKNETYYFTNEMGDVKDSKDPTYKSDWDSIVSRMEENKKQREQIDERMRSSATASTSSSALSEDDERKLNMRNLIENSVLDDEVKSKLLNAISNNTEGNYSHLSLEELVVNILTENSKDLIKGLSDRLIKLKTKALNQEEQEMLFQVPMVYGGGKKRENRNKINILRDPEFIAEIECIQPGLIWLLLSGSLSIGNKMAKRWKTQMKIYGKIMGDLKNNKKGKIFLLNICRLVLNDATPSKDEDSCLDIWNGLYDRIANLMIDDEEDDSQGEDIFRDLSGGKLKYNVSGERNIYNDF